nr:ankyrin repeat domain-containing protein 26-like [Nerophis lumbriciformis]
MAPNISSGQTLGYKEKTRDMDIFHKAALQGDMRKLQLTSICGDVNKPDKFNRTALHLACANGHAEVVSFLIGKKAKINLCDDQKRTALMTAVQCKNDIIVSILLENNANPDLVDLDGNTALHLASKIPSMESVILLVKKDAAINTKNLKGLSPLAMAIRGNHIAMAEFLLKKGADVDILDKHQRSPLMIAAGNGHMDMVRMLLMFKADFTLKDNKGLSAEDYALTNEHRPCALLISEHAAKRYPGPFLSPSVKCEEIVKPERVNSREASNTWGEPSTSKDGSPEMSIIESDDEGSFHSNMQQQKLEIASEDSVVESAENSLKEKTLDDCQLPEKTVLQGAEELMSTEEPQLHLTEMESCVVSGTAGQNTSDETKVGMCQSIKLEEPEVPPETSKTMKHPSASRDTGEKASEELANQQLETKLLSPRELLGEPSQQLHQYVPSRIKVESQLPPEQTFHIRPGGHLEDNSQLPMVSEALGPRFPQNNGGITDLSMRDRTLSDLLKDDCRWKSAEWPKRTRTPILNNDDSEISEDSDKLLSEDSDFAHNIQGLETTDSRSKMNFQDKVNQRFLKAKCYLGSAGERLRQLEIDKRILEETNLELQTDNTNLTIQLKTAITNIVAYESANKKLEEDYRQAQSIVVQNQSTLSLLHQKVNSLVSKQKEMEEECRRSKSNEEQLRSELEEFQADSNIKQRDLSEENETLKDEVENLHQDLTISRDNENQNALHWNNTITSLKYELQMVNTQLETERQAQDHLVGELQSIRSRLAEGEQARLDMEKALLLEKDENQRLTSQAGCHLETVNKLSEKLSKLKAHSNTMESDVHRYEVQMAEKTTQLNNVQRENEQTSLRVKELETALQAEKELLVRATSRQETTQALLNQAQNEGTSLRQRLEEATAIAVAKENALSEAKKSFNDSMFKLRTECEERVQKAQCTYTELACKVPELESLVRKLEQEKTERQTSSPLCPLHVPGNRTLSSGFAQAATRSSDVSQFVLWSYSSCFPGKRALLPAAREQRVAHLKQLQQELDDSLKKLSKCEASLEFHARYRSDYEEEKTRLLRDVDKLKTKLHEKDTQCIQAEKLINERASILDERERELSFAARKNKDAQAAVDASNNVAKQLEEDMRRLELDNIRLEAAAKQHSNKFGALQRAAEEDARVDTEKKKWEELAEHKKAAECRLEQEMKRNSDLQREIYRLQTLLKAAKKKLQEQQFSVAEREKLNQQVHELQAELEREQFSFNQLERSKKQLEDDLLNLRRTQAPTLDGGFMGLAANPLGYQYRCHCPKSFNPVSEGPSYSVQDYLAKMRQDLDIAMSRELGNSSVKLDMALTCVSPVTKARQQYVTALKKNREV